MPNYLIHHVGRTEQHFYVHIYKKSIRPLMAGIVLKHVLSNF
jgi:hypothetical protein